SVRTRETEVALWTRPSGFPRAAAAKMLKSSLKATSVVRVIADPGKARKIKGLEVLDGKGIWTEQLCGARYVAHAPSFFQVNTAQAEKLVEQAVLALGGSIGDAGPAGLDGMLVADLYAGCGTFGVALARAGADVIAVESAASSVRDLRRNADENSVDIDVIGGDAARELPQLGGLDALVVDPPRAGLADGVPADIAAARPSRVVYVSCNPATWARDVRRFEDVGYRLERVQPVDLFPQTYHVELVSCFVRC
ncbi:class I SAM-dependent RNA methyltransferase, partial [uncultured Senegalimassilia sp.]